MGFAFEAHEDLNLDTFGRIDVFDAIVADRVRLHFRPVDCAALYLPPSVAGRAGVLVNELHPLALQRYSAAHEYGHHVLGHGEQIDREAEPSGSGATLPPHEMLAEAFAAWFLMPPEAVDVALGLLGLEEAATAADAYALSLRLGTSFRATCNRVSQLNRWRDESPKRLKEELLTTPPPGGWRHDAWLLTVRDTDAKVVARCGDTLLVLLPGWDVDSIPDGALAELVPGPDLLTPPHWRIDLPPALPAGPASIVLREASSTLSFDLRLERPHAGRYVPTPRSLHS